MRTCPQCGATVQDTDDFCGSCGTYLGWRREVESGDVLEDGQSPLVGGADPADARPSAGQPAVAPSEPDQPTTAQPTTAQPVAVQPTTAQPVAVQPARPVTRRPAPSPTVAAPVGSGRPCAVCGTPNPPDRRYCRRCAAVLVPVSEPPPGRTPWYRRLRLPTRSGSDTGSPWPRRLVLLVVVAALVAGAILAFPLGRDLVEDLRDKTSTPAAIAPVSTTASAAVADHPAAAAVDGATNRYWGAPAVGASIDFTFAAPFRLLAVVVHAGASTRQDLFAQQARPARIDLLVTTADGATRTLDVALADQPGPQRTDTGISNVVRIQLVIRAAGGLTDGRHIALGEIEFFRRP